VTGRERLLLASHCVSAYILRNAFAEYTNEADLNAATVFPFNHRDVREAALIVDSVN